MLTTRPYSARTNGLPSWPAQLGIDGSLAGWPVVVFVLGLVAVIVLCALELKGVILWTRSC